MPKTRRRRSRRGGKKWWQFWKKEPKPTPLSFNNAEMVKKPLKGVKRFDPEAFISNGAEADGRRYSAALKTAAHRNTENTTLDARTNKSSPYDKERRRTAPARGARAARRAEDAQSGRGRFRKRRRSRRRSRRRRSRRRRSRRRRSRRRRSRRRRH